MQILKAYDKVHQTLVSRGIFPTTHVLDNEVSSAMKSYITSHGINLQIVPPNQHRANAAEPAIHTFKNHFISTLCSCDPEFPLHLWDRLLDQAVITLNLLRTSTINNCLSTYAQLHGSFNFSTTPLGPPGTKVIVHDKPNQRGTWSPHGTLGWYIGPSMNHYRCFETYIPSTRTTWITDTLAWFPTHVTMPTASSTDLAMAAVYDLTQALLHPSPASALAPMSDSQRHALIQLATIFSTPSSGTPSTDIDNEPAVTDQVAYLDATNTVEPRVDVPRGPMNAVPTDTVEPRVDRPTPSMAATEPRMAPVLVEADEPRVCFSTLISSGITESLSSHLTTNVPVDQPINDVSYFRYNHNGPQRRRRQRHNRRHRNPIQPSTITIPSASDRHFNRYYLNATRYYDYIYSHYSPR